MEKEKITNEQKAEILVQALPYIKKYTGETIVIKYGGSAMGGEDNLRSTMRDIVLLQQIGVKVVLVHGGGPEINEMLKKVGKQGEFIGGLRKTDDETIEIVQMVLAGKVNKNLVNMLELEGGSAIGLCGIDGHMIEVTPIREELGYVGQVSKVNTKPIEVALAACTIPVISTIGFDAKGKVYNINADTVASRLAGELKAKSLINMTDTLGILRDKDDPSSLISVIKVSEAAKLIKDGVISGGMLPKVECCVEAIRRGVKRVFIIDGKVKHSLLIETLSDEGIGTMFC